jgi:hypothetical protein
VKVSSFHEKAQDCQPRSELIGPLPFALYGPVWTVHIGVLYSGGAAICLTASRAREKNAVAENATFALNLCPILIKRWL